MICCNNRHFWQYDSQTRQPYRSKLKPLNPKIIESRISGRPFQGPLSVYKNRKKDHMVKTLRFSCDLVRISDYSLSLNLYPIPHMVRIYSGESGFGSIFFRNFRINAMILLSSSR